MPGSLKNLVQTKLDGLPARQRHGLRVASAIGQYFSLELLRAALGQPEHELTLPVRQCIVRPAEAGRYVFVHDLVMQGIYESMTPAQCAAIHLTLARCYGRADRQLRALHLRKARQLDARAATIAASAGGEAALIGLRVMPLLRQRLAHTLREN